MGKKTPQAPTPPDPVATAAAQGQMNKDTAIANANLNRINQYTPQGSLTYQVTGTNPDGTPKYEQTQTYSPGEQAVYDAQNKVSQALSNTALDATGRANAAMNTPWDTSGFTPMQTSIPGAGQGIQSSYNPGGQQQTSFNAGGPIQSNYASGGDVQKSLDFSNLSKLPGINDFSADAQAARNNAYSAATSRLDPQFQQEQRQLGAQLAGKGVSEDSVAYRNAMDQFARQKTDAYNQANYSSYGAGGQEQSRLFGLALSGRQQGAQEALTQGNFANTAQAQAEQQNAARAGFGNEAQQQQYTQNQGLGEFYNNAQAAQNTQNAAQAAFANNAQQGAYTQNAANATFGNQARQQQTAEASYARELPINEIASLMSGAGQVQGPQFHDYNATNVGGVNYMGAVQDQYNAQQQQYQQQLAQRNAGLGAVFGLAGSALKAIPFSDRRLKHTIKAIGQTASGINTYVFSYIGSKLREFGVMADEVFKVLPEAVGSWKGYMTVDYGKVWEHGAPNISEA